MTALRARLAAAVVTVTAAAAVLAGCGGGHSEAAARPSATPTTDRPASSAPAIGPDGTTETSAPPSGGADGGESKEPTLPKAQLTPATGTFTDRQKDYLVGKVPKGMDPAAILQTGQDSCDRIANTADASPKLAREAIADGEIADAKDAITYLCPKYTSLLK